MKVLKKFVAVAISVTMAFPAVPAFAGSVKEGTAEAETMQAYSSKKKIYTASKKNIRLTVGQSAKVKVVYKGKGGLSWTSSKHKTTCKIGKKKNNKYTVTIKAKKKGKDSVLIYSKKKPSEKIQFKITVNSSEKKEPGQVVQTAEADRLSDVCMSGDIDLDEPSSDYTVFFRLWADKNKLALGPGTAVITITNASGKTVCSKTRKFTKKDLRYTSKGNGYMVDLYKYIAMGDTPDGTLTVQVTMDTGKALDPVQIPVKNLPSVSTPENTNITLKKGETKKIKVKCILDYKHNVYWWHSTDSSVVQVKFKTAKDEDGTEYVKKDKNHMATLVIKGIGVGASDVIVNASEDKNADPKAVIHVNVLEGEWTESEIKVAGTNVKRAISFLKSVQQTADRGGYGRLTSGQLDSIQTGIEFAEDNIREAYKAGKDHPEFVSYLKDAAECLDEAKTETNGSSIYISVAIAQSALLSADSIVDQAELDRLEGQMNN